jgi:hypothetical protein
MKVLILGQASCEFLRYKGQAENAHYENFFQHESN